MVYLAFVPNAIQLRLVTFAKQSLFGLTNYTANTFRISLTDKSNTGFLTGQSWRVLKCWCLGDDPEQGFWRYFADRLNQKFIFVSGAV